MLQVRDLYKSFPTDLSDVQAVDHIGFEVARGKFFSLLGPSGCGKTTTLRCIAGLERPEQGEIEVDGHLVFSKQGVFVPPVPSRYRDGFSVVCYLAAYERFRECRLSFENRSQGVLP